MRTHTNIAEYSNRRLKKQWDGAGAFVLAANSTKVFDVTAPSKREHSHGVTGKNGVVSIVSLDGGNQNYTLWEWHEGMARVNGGNGWILNGSNAAEYTKTCDQRAKISFTASEGVPFFVQVATTAVSEAFVSGTKDDAKSVDNTDLTGNTH